MRAVTVYRNTASTHIHRLLLLAFPPSGVLKAKRRRRHITYSPDQRSRSTGYHLSSIRQIHHCSAPSSLPNPPTLFNHRIDATADFLAYITMSTASTSPAGLRGQGRPIRSGPPRVDAKSKRFRVVCSSSLLTLQIDIPQHQAIHCTARYTRLYHVP